jgi:Protein of unknown function (DUF2778)
MTDTVASSDAFTPFGGGTISLGSFRRVAFGGVAIGLGAIAAAWVIATTLTVATTWMAAAFHSAKHTMQPRAPNIAPEAMALANPYGIQASTMFGSARVVAVPESAPALASDVTFDPEWGRATAQSFAPATSPPGLSEHSFELVASLPSQPPHPLPPPRVQTIDPLSRQATYDVVRAPDATREAELTPPVTSPSGATSTVSPQPKRSLERADSEPSPEPGSLDGAKRDGARPPAGSARPQVAALPPSPPASGLFSFFEKLFSPQQTYGNSNLLPGPDSRTAVYDIEARTVYLPNGSKLEAHSGMGQWLDDPRYVNEKDRGATPPHTYDLALRESLFHGVRAIRLNPVGEGNMFGRDGILAHPYMLGPNGQSNGCVSFKDYPEFLRAFLNGEVKQLVVVPRLGGKPLRTAHTPRRRHADRYASAN